MGRRLQTLKLGKKTRHIATKPTDINENTMTPVCQQMRKPHTRTNSEEYTTNTDSRIIKI